MVASLARAAPIAEAPHAMDELTTPGSTDTGVSGAADTGPYSAREAATVLGVSERTVRRAIARGELTARKRAGVFRITPEALSHYLDQQPRGAPLRSARQHVSSRSSPEPPPALPMLRLVAPTRGPAFSQPQPLTPFLGREREVAALVAALNRPELRLLTLSWPRRSRQDAAGLARSGGAATSLWRWCGVCATGPPLPTLPSFRLPLPKPSACASMTAAQSSNG